VPHSAQTMTNLYTKDIFEPVLLVTV